MKNIFRVSIFGLMMAALVAVSAVSGFAQTNPCDDTFEVKTAEFQKYRDTVKNPLTIAKAKSGIQIAEAFIAKYGACEDAKQVVDYLNGKTPALKTFIVEEEKKEILKKFDDAIKDPKTVNAPVAFSTAKDVVAMKPEASLDVALVLASIGYDNAVKAAPVTTFDNEAISNAKAAIQALESGKTSPTFGFWSYNYAIKDAKGNIDQAKSKDNALAWMNYTIATIMFYNQKNQKDALAYFYKAAQINSDVKNKAGIYQPIGAWYLEELLKINAAREAALTANEGKDTEETLAQWALVKGYADRAIDAYARAYKLAPTTDAAYRTGLFEKLQALYKIRFDNTNGIENYVSTVMNKPLPDPTTAVTPVVEEKPTTTSTTSTTSITTPSTTTKSTDNSSVTTTKPTTETSKPVTTKKKGTR